MPAFIVKDHPKQITWGQFNCSHPINEIIYGSDDGTVTKCMFCNLVQTDKVQFDCNGWGFASLQPLPFQ